MRLVVTLIAVALLLSCGPAGGLGRSSAISPAGASGVRADSAMGTAQQGFEGSISKLGAALRRRMRGSSWHKGCPVALDDLRLLNLGYRGFDREVHRGRMIVRKQWALPVLGVFRTLFRAKFRFRRIALADVFEGDDHKLMKANITSAFNCRFVEGQQGVWSEHAYGRAIDINPVQNPYVSGDTILPPAGERYLNRKRWRPGMIHGGDVVVSAFASLGWGWGGHFHSLKDYMHFSATGR
jgi:D-alanyl-D-alanine carboxypeptidase